MMTICDLSYESHGAMSFKLKASKILLIITSIECYHSHLGIYRISVEHSYSKGNACFEVCFVVLGRLFPQWNG